MTEKYSCKSCGRTLPDDAPGGLCPACVMLAASEPEVSIAGPSIEEIQRAFPQLEIVGCIGRGGMGIVYKAFQPSLGRHVALKLLDPGLHAQPDFAERFAREARFLGKLAHPNIVGIHDFGETDGHFWLMMEYVDGVNLRQAMQAGRFTPAQALAIIPDLCTALQFAHDQGVLHRDIKPENILLDAKGRVKLADFGIARLSRETKDFTLTRTGSTLGSTAYSAPEQIESPQDVDHRADIYSLGVVFYEMLTGELPLGRFAAPSEKSTSDPGLDEVVFRALEKERGKRYQSADEVKSRVTGFSPSPIAGMSGPSRGLSGSAKLPLILFLSGIGSLLAFTASTERFIAQFYWRKLWDPVSSANHSINLESALYKQFLNLWFGSGLLLLGAGVALGLWKLHQIKRGKSPPDGWVLLRRLILWPCLLIIPVCIVSLALGRHPLMFSQGQIQYAHWIVAAVSYAFSAALFRVGAAPAGMVAPPRSRRVWVAAASVVLLFSASLVTKQLNDHWTDDHLPFELTWDLGALDDPAKGSFLEAITRTAASFPAEMRRDRDHVEVRIVIPKEPVYYMVYQNAFLLKLRAIAPDETWSMGQYSTKVWWETKVAMQWPTVFVLFASSLAAIMAAWCGPPYSRVAILSGVAVAALLALLPARPIPEEIGKRVVVSPPDPTQPFIPVFSEQTLAVQSVFDAAFLGEWELARAGMSKRLLAGLHKSGDFQSSPDRLRKRRFVTNSSGDTNVWVACPAEPEGKPLVAIVREDGEWKLDELPY